MEVLAKFGGHAALFADEAGFILPNSVFMTVLHCAFITFPFLILLVMYHIAHIDMEIFQICVLSYSTLLLQYGAQNLGGKEINSRLG
jgi:hypothetical protein